MTATIERKGGPMDVSDALRRRRMVRSFDGAALEADLVSSLFEDSLRAPTAGNSRGISWLLFSGSDEVASYFSVTTDAEWRATSTRFEGLSRASAVGVCLADPTLYTKRYSEDDKKSSGLGEHVAAWPVPYWIGDAGAASLAALLLAEDQGLAACFLGAFRGIELLRDLSQIPEGIEIYGSVLLGRPDGNDHRSPSLDLPGPTRSERVHRALFSPNPSAS